jgi:hypothetical protein
MSVHITWSNFLKRWTFDQTVCLIGLKSFLEFFYSFIFCLRDFFFQLSY